MARGRMLSKSLSTSEKFAKLVELDPLLCEFCHALYPLMLTHTDDFGRLQGDPFTVRLQCYPASRRGLDAFADALLLLHQVELITWYASGDKRFIQIENFEPHQAGLHKRTKSRFPELSDASRKVPEIPGNSRTFPEIPSEEKRREEKRTVQKATPSVPPQTSALQARVKSAAKKNGELRLELQEKADVLKSRTKEFVEWFQVVYRVDRHGADYLVKWDRDMALVKQMLHATSFERLQKFAKILLSDSCDEDWIVTTDRGIPILSSKFNWLSDRLATWEREHGFPLAH